ncbi:MAG TPA: ABC transporter ATP-binding protein [bacterium]|nr:ABC transporter ATP-binding protein [bacterium]
MNSNGYAIQVKGLSKHFGDLVAVNGLDLEVREGEIFGFLGPNGSGKSTTIRMLCGLLQPTAGSGQVAGNDIIREPEKIKRVIGYMSQHFGLYADLTVEENVEFYSGIYLGKRSREVKEKVIADLGLTRYRKFLAGNLSGGWKQRLALACAISHRPKILFLDEPTAGIDPMSRRTLWDLLYEMAERGVTLFVTTHYMDEAEHCHRLGFIMEGMLTACATPQQIKTQQMRGEVIMLRSGNNTEAYAALKDVEGLIDVNVYGDSIHLVAGSADEASPLVRRALEAAGVEVHELTRTEPTIEDVFVSLSKVAAAMANGERPGNEGNKINKD